MPSMADAQMDSINHVRDEAGLAANGMGTGSTMMANLPIEPAPFGRFVEEIKSPMATIQACFSTLSGAFSELDGRLKQYQDVVCEVQKNHGKLQEKDERISELETLNRGFTDVLEQYSDKHKEKVQNLKADHKAELARWQDRADAGDREKQRYEDLGRQLEAQRAIEIEKMERKLYDRRIELETANATKIANLEKERTALTDEMNRLQQDLQDKTAQYDHAMAIQEQGWKERNKLKGDLEKIKAQYEMQSQSLGFYEKGCMQLVERVKQITESHFSRLPEKALEDPAGTSKALKGAPKFFKRMPISTSDTSKVLRLAGVQNVIYGVIRDHLWRPFISGYLLIREQASAILPDIHQILASRGANVQHDWKVSTLKALDDLEDNSDKPNLESYLDNLIANDIVSKLMPLLDDKHANDFSAEMRRLFLDAIELAKKSDRDLCPIDLDMNPTRGSPDWREYLPKDHERSNAGDLTPISPTQDSNLGPLCVRPRIFRTLTREQPSTSKTTATILLVHDGIALFPETGIFQDGTDEWWRIQGAGSEIARNPNGSLRRASVQSAMVGSAAVIDARPPARSKLPPSQTWPQGMGDGPN